MTRFDKPYRTPAEQLLILRDRGMIVADETAARQALERIGYYRLSGYWYIHRRRPPAVGASTAGSAVADDFVPGTTFESVRRLYEFDRRLRLHILDAIERVEIALRVQVGSVLGAGHPFAHLDPAALDRLFTCFDEQHPVASRAAWLGSRHVQWLGTVRRAEERSKEEFVSHFKTRYGMPLPVWVVTELLTFGGLAMILGGLKPTHKNLVAEAFGIYDKNCDGDGARLVNWVANLVYLRNTCAHHVRVWNKNIVEQIGCLDDIAELAHAGSVRSRSRVYASLAVLAYLIGRLEDSSTWRRDTVRLVEDGLGEVGQSASRLGCPPGWSEEPLWSPAHIPGADPVPAEHRAILRRFECIGPAEVGAVLDGSASAKRRSSAVRASRGRSELLGFVVGSSYRYPVFQFDAVERDLFAVVARIHRELRARDRPWEVGKWWIEPNDRFGGSAPLDLLRAGRLTEAAFEAAMVSAPVG